MADKRAMVVGGAVVLTGALGMSIWRSVARNSVLRQEVAQHKATKASLAKLQTQLDAVISELESERSKHTQELAAERTESARLRSELTEKLGEHEALQSTHAETQSQLAQAISRHTEQYDELTARQETIQNFRLQLAAMRDELESANVNLESSRTRLAAKILAYDDLEADLRSSQMEVSTLTAELEARNEAILRIEHDHQRTLRVGSKAEAAADSSVATGWTCGNCGRENDGKRARCSHCGMPPTYKSPSSPYPPVRSASKTRRSRKQSPTSSLSPSRSVSSSNSSATSTPGGSDLFNDHKMLAATSLALEQLAKRKLKAKQVQKQTETASR